MAKITPAGFEALWEGVKNQPRVRTAQAAPIQADLSLTGILNHYMAMAAQHRDQGKISQQDYADLNTAAEALKAVLARVNDSALVADAVTQNAARIELKIRSKTSGTQER